MKTNERGVMAHRRQVVVVGYERKHNGRDPQWDHYVLYAQEIGNRDPELRYWLSNGYTVCEAVSDKAFREARRKAAQHSRAGSLQGLVRTTSEFRRWLSPAFYTTLENTCKGSKNKLRKQRLTDRQNAVDPLPSRVVPERGSMAEFKTASTPNFLS